MRWLATIQLGDIWRNADFDFPARRDAIVVRLRATRWCKTSDEVQSVVDELAAADNAEDFDEWWSALYDLADADRVWIDLHASIDQRTEARP